MKRSSFLNTPKVKIENGPSKSVTETADVDVGKKVDPKLMPFEMLSHIQNGKDQTKNVNDNIINPNTSAMTYKAEVPIKTENNDQSAAKENTSMDFNSEEMIDWISTQSAKGSTAPNADQQSSSIGKENNPQTSTPIIPKSLSKAKNLKNNLPLNTSPAGTSNLMDMINKGQDINELATGMICFKIRSYFFDF